MRLININCDNSDSIKYSILLYLYCYNIKINYNRPTEINKHGDLLCLFMLMMVMI